MLAKCAWTMSEELRRHAQANGAAKAEEGKAAGQADGSAADVDMQDAAGPSNAASGGSNLHKGQLTGKEPPSCSPTAATKFLARYSCSLVALPALTG